MVMACPNTCTPTRHATSAVHEKSAGTSAASASTCTAAMGTR